MSIKSLYRSVDLDRVYKEQFGICIKSTDSNTDLYRVYTETRSELIWVYSESTQDNTDLHKFYKEQFLFTESTQTVWSQRIYTESTQSISESTQSLYRVYAEQYIVYTADADSTESTEDNSGKKIEKVNFS